MKREPLRGEWSKGRVVLDGILYQRVFQEDDATLHDPDRTTVSDAERGFLGRGVIATAHFDGGDVHADVEPGLAIVTHSYDGSELFLVPSVLPYAALFGSDQKFAFEAMASIRDAFRSGQSAKMPLVVRHRWNEACMAAEAVAGVIQNQTRLSSTEYASLIAEVDRVLALRDPILVAMGAEPTLQWVRRILVASVLPSSVSRSVDSYVDEEIVL